MAIPFRILSPTPKLKTTLFSPSACFLSSLPSNEIAYSTKPSISTVVSALTHHRSKSRWRYLRSLCPNGFGPDEFSQITLQLKNNPHLAHRFFLWTQNKSLCNHNLTSYSTIIHILARGRRRAAAQTLIRSAIRVAELEDDDSKGELSSKPLKVFETLVKTYKQCGSAPFVFDLLIKALLDSKRIDPSIEIVRMLRSRGISPQVSTLNSLILWVSRCQGSIAGYEIYREVFDINCEVCNRNLKRGSKVSPNLHTFNALMVCFYQDGLNEKVKEIWNQIVKSNIFPNNYSYSILMAALCEEKRMGEAEKLWEEMRVKKVEPDVVAYNTMIGGFCKIRDIGRAEEFFRDLEMNGIESTSATYELLINGYAEIGDVSSAMLVYKDMCRKHFRADALTIEALIRGLCFKNRVLEALEILRGGVGDCNICPTGESYQLLIKGLCEEGKIEEAFKLQAEMVGKGYKPNREIYRTFIDCYTKQGNEEMAELLRNEMIEAQLNQDEN